MHVCIKSERHAFYGDIYLRVQVHIYEIFIFFVGTFFLMVWIVGMPASSLIAAMISIHRVASFSKPACSSGVSKSNVAK